MLWNNVLPTMAAGIGGTAAEFGMGKIFKGGVNFDAHKAQKKAKEFARWQIATNYNQAKEFAQHGIRWKAEDAKKAGLSPLVALGGSTYSPSAIGVNIAAQRSRRKPFTGMGQDLSRAIRATKTPEERALDLASLQEVQARGRYYNALADKALNDVTQTGPAIGGAVTWPGNISDRVGTEVQPSKVEARGKGGVAAGGSPMHQVFQDKNKAVRFLITQGASEPLESSPYWKLHQAIRDIGDYANNIHHYYDWRTSYAAKQRQSLRYLRSIIKGTPNIQQPGRGREWRYDPWSGLFVFGSDSGGTYIYSKPPKGFRAVIRKKIR